MTDVALERVARFVRRFAELDTGAEPAALR